MIVHQWHNTLMKPHIYALIIEHGLLLPTLSTYQWYLTSDFGNFLETMKFTHKLNYRVNLKVACTQQLIYIEQEFSLQHFQNRYPPKLCSQSINIYHNADFSYTFISFMGWTNN